jgi:predicted CopG family antitoxin
MFGKGYFSAGAALPTARRARSAGYAFRSSGNQAFDAYKAETLRRLEDEQKAFEEFLQRLREARDKAEFDQFMKERDTRSKHDQDETAHQQG